MSLEKILKKINDNAQAEIKRIILESEKKAADIKEKAQQEASQKAEALVKEIEKEANLEASRLITKARLQKKINLLKRKKELIDEVLSKAFEEEKLDKKKLIKKIILKEGERQEQLEVERLKEELRPKLENYIAEVLKI